MKKLFFCLFLFVFLSANIINSYADEDVKLKTAAQVISISFVLLDILNGMGIGVM